MATELMSYELNGVKESIADWISNISPREFVYQSMIGKGSTTQPKFEWQVDYDEAVDDANALMEGFEFKDLDDGFVPTTVLTGYTQKMGKAVKVTGDADAQSAWGRGKESTYQATKKARALKRDLEYALLNNGKSVAEVKGDTPRMLGGFQSLVSSIDGGDTITPDPLSGVTTFIEAAADKPTSQEILDGMAALWETGAVVEVIMVSNTMSDVISGMQEEGNKQRIFENTPKITYEVNTITDPLGQTVKVVYNRHMPANTVYLFNPDDWQIIMFRAPITELQGKSGDYIRSVLHMDVGQRHRNPWASAVIVPKPTAATSEITSVTVAALDDAITGVDYSATATATLVDPDDGTYTQEWAISGTAADGLDIDSDGAISGTPTTAGDATVKLTVTDASGGSKSGTATLTVNAAAVLTDAGDVQIGNGGVWNTQFPSGSLYAGEDVDFEVRVSGMDAPDDGSYEFDFKLTGASGGLSLVNTDQNLAHVTGSTPEDQAGLTLNVTCTVIDKAGNSLDATAVSGDWGSRDLLQTLENVDGDTSAKKAKKVKKSD